MSAGKEWYVAQDGEVVGPLSPSELAAVMGTKGPPLLVWAEGLEGWTEAGEVEALRSVLGLPAQPEGGGDDLAAVLAPHKPSMKERARHELIEYAVIAVYLYICFGALTLYKAAILRGEGIPFAPMGFAIAKALILGKFMLLLKATKLGERRAGGGRMILDIGRKALVFALALIVLTFIEEILVGWFHHKTPAAVVAEMTGDSLLQVLATTLLMVLVLIPYFAFHELTERLGEGALLRMLVERHEREGKPQGSASKGAARREAAA